MQPGGVGHVAVAVGIGGERLLGERLIAGVDEILNLGVPEPVSFFGERYAGPPVEVQGRAGYTVLGLGPGDEPVGGVV